MEFDGDENPHARTDSMDVRSSVLSRLALLGDAIWLIGLDDDVRIVIMDKRPHA